MMLPSVEAEHLVIVLPRMQCIEVGDAIDAEHHRCRCRFFSAASPIHG
jgi:hypothetical protein